MSRKQNLHIHTTYVDGKDTPEALILEAISRGFDSIGFSEHSFNRYSSYTHQMTVADMDSYKAEVRALKAKYRGRFDVFCGLELDLYSDVPTDGFDYLIGSVHYLEINGTIAGFDRSLPDTLTYVNNHFGGDGLQFARTYFETIARLPERAPIDIIGHFDVLTKNNEAAHFLPVTSAAYLHAGYEAIHALKGRIPFFELNTGAISRGYRTAPYPQMEFLKEFCRCGFGAVITSDCHDKSTLDCFYEEATAMLSAAGFRTKWILTDNGFEEDAL